MPYLCNQNVHVYTHERWRVLDWYLWYSLPKPKMPSLNPIFTLSPSPSVSFHIQAHYHPYIPTTCDPPKLWPPDPCKSFSGWKTATLGSQQLGKPTSKAETDCGSDETSDPFRINQYKSLWNIQDLHIYIYIIIIYIYILFIFYIYIYMFTICHAICLALWLFQNCSAELPLKEQ